MEQGYSVLMSVYHKEKPDALHCAMESIWNQTIPTDDFVLICDGPLTEELDDVISDMSSLHPKTLHVVRLPENKGLGNALNIGLSQCQHELVARMDSDDISLSDRCERQLNCFRIFPELAICSGTVEEFSMSPEKVEASRTLPETDDEIRAFAKKRNPFNHPCVMYKKSAVEAAGNYQHFYLLEDYYLWIRMLQRGAKGFNIREPLLLMRAGSEMYRRRSGLKYAMSQRDLFRYMKQVGMINTAEYLRAVATRTIASVIPNGLRKTAYKIVMRT